MKNKVVIALLTLVLIAGLGAGAVFLGTRGVTTPAANRKQRKTKKRRPPKKRLPRK